MTRPRDIWPLIHAERAALADDLAELTDEQWTTPSLCEGLSVREVLAHITVAAGIGPMNWLAGVIRARFDFDRQVAERLATRLGATPQETLAAFRAVVASRTKPPLPVVAMLGEAIVHGEDIRRPLGIRRAYPIETLTLLAEYYSHSNLMLDSKQHVQGVRLIATDGPFRYGTGPEVTGTTLALTMAMTGRKGYWEELTRTG
ncbi:maleylpyruvate isomerase family mycothiol-dependent enzyme [Streptosporangium minutum]|uniref:maleylpyruvate isomerase family mycothiol-dependent enzyme n=1 Tax=Streptosporangium minutum TaxID=569862 RepID=UPI001A99ADEB|nr:maleylpyruvate isomerase family mycothiol-dependent enzyme [Streptosporangium minutum]